MDPDEEPLEEELDELELLLEPDEPLLDELDDELPVPLEELEDELPELDELLLPWICTTALLLITDPAEFDTITV